MQSIWTAEKENTITITIRLCLCLCIWTYLTVLGRIGLIYPPVVLTQGCRLESQQSAELWEVGRSHGDTATTSHSQVLTFFGPRYLSDVRHY